MRLTRRRKVLMLLMGWMIVTFSTWLLHYGTNVHDLVSDSQEPSSGWLWSEAQVILEVGEPAREGILLLEGYGYPRLTFRMWCAVESAARAHPHLPVSLLMTSPVIKDSSLLHNLTGHLKNIHLLHLNTTHLFQGSPLHTWYQQRKWRESFWPLSHFNDAVRWLLLWKYGGVYLDLDVMVLRPLTRLPNCTALESRKYVAAGVLKFTPNHPLMRACLDYFAQNFDGTVWGGNGPELLTQVLIDRCGLELSTGRVPRCPDVTVLPSRAFYPIAWWEWRRYLEDDARLADDLLDDPKVYALHMWNLHTRHVPVLLTSQQPYARVANAHCPITAAHAGLLM
ncbi:lactosylceramide 4-alpha-galactosyltransferase-like isoform X2 [Homarus americanus]|uniref:lactosylceramide 4-alpha-galactosyltransferase-like isoform X2 n=1 Tax=Homarus americanus TaxID=6706 RepID=UPI001C47AF82|nr:lactosylceramide 4-alpha-galactosyltransferase-like isoform X2 [Homarus americanus]